MYLIGDPQKGIIRFFAPEHQKTLKVMEISLGKSISMHLTNIGQMTKPA